MQANAQIRIDSFSRYDPVENEQYKLCNMVYNLSKLTKTSEQSYWHEDIKKQWRCSGVFIVKSEQIPLLLGIRRSVATWVYQQRSKGREVKIKNHAKAGPNYAMLTKRLK